MRRTGAGFQGTGTSGGSRPISGMGAGPERVPSRAGFFAAGHAGPPEDFFTAGIPRIPARPLRRFPRAFREGISFRAEGHFVSDFSREKIDQWSQCVAGHENLKRNETQKNRHAEVCKCGA